MQDPIYERLDKKWKSACKLLFGTELGELDGYKDWLCENLEPAAFGKSAISGKDVKLVGKYCNGAQFLSFDEIDYAKKFTPLNLNEMKDIDSLIEAVSERVIYSGNIILGNSSQVENSSGVENSHFIYESHTLHNSEDIAYTTLAREDKAIFGSVIIGESEFCIRLFNAWRAMRCFEGSKIIDSSDIYYSHAIYGCMDCMFCFNLKGKRHCIGNAELPKEKYLELKKKLLSELAGELLAKRRLRSLSEMLSALAQSNAHPAVKEMIRENNVERMQEDFRKVSELVLGKKMEMGPLEEYLRKNIRAIVSSKSAISEGDVFGDELVIDRRLAESRRLVKLIELEAISVPRNWPKKIASEEIGMSNIGKFIEPVAYVSSEEEGQNKNTVECSSVLDAADCYRCSRVYEGKDCGHSFWPRNCEFMFGCDSTRNSSFCINCCNSFKISRCFETDTSQNCTGCYFVHNCENVHDSMFCFNVKNLRYAIGNAEVGREKFLEAKGRLLKEITDSLEKKRDFKWNIYNIGCAGKKK